MNGTRSVTLERKEGEAVSIGDAIEVEVEAIESDRVRLRFRAPAALPVACREVIDSVAAENRKAALSRLPTMEDLCRLLEGV